MQLTVEQEMFIEYALSGQNVLVDACIGSGKTTAIQHLCDRFDESQKILYLTYNKLLKIDAKDKIKNRNVFVTNYHGFAYNTLKTMGISAGISDMIKAFNRERPRVSYDILIIDEYQDIEQELADMLDIIKENNPHIQIVAVGDMRQKIYDKTSLDVEKFILRFLGSHKTLEFTQCFRLNAEHAAMLGRIWNKKITGVNRDCKVSFMSQKEAMGFIVTQNPSDIICLGSRQGMMTDTLNLLENEYPDKFNKNTIYASISDDDRGSSPRSDSGIFTTFDSSKGLERKVCVIFDFSMDYWQMRARMPQSRYEILRNIFCVAASRGKEHIIFVQSIGHILLDEKTLSTPFSERLSFRDLDISEMFDFKFKEDIEECYSLLDVQPYTIGKEKDIAVETTDGLIDLSPCIGIYQEALFFNKYNIDKAILHVLKMSEKNREKEGRNNDFKRAAKYETKADDYSLDDKVLYLTALTTHQNRYVHQVRKPFINKEATKAILNRLGSVFSPDEEEQTGCSISFFDASHNPLFEARGFSDVIKDDTVWELKFISELSHEHYLQCACYMVAHNKEKGIIWNTRTNQAFMIRIRNRATFMDKVTKAVTKRAVVKYYAG